MYFAKFPPITYPFVINGQTVYKQITDVTLNVRMFEILKQYATVYDEYDMLDGETPEIVAEKAYGSPLYHWVIMLLNERYDYVNDFPKDQVTLETYIKDKYGVEFKIQCSQTTANAGTAILTTASTERLIEGQDISYFVEYIDANVGDVVYFDPPRPNLTQKTSRIIQIVDETNFVIDDKISSYSTTINTPRLTASLIPRFRNQSAVVTIGNLPNPMYDIHHYVDSDGYIVNAGNVNLDNEIDAIEVSNYEYELQQNEAKRRIKLLSEQNLFALLAQFKNLI